MFEKQINIDIYILKFCSITRREAGSLPLLALQFQGKFLTRSQDPDQFSPKFPDQRLPIDFPMPNYTELTMLLDQIALISTLLLQQGLRALLLSILSFFHFIYAYLSVLFVPIA